MYLIVNSFPILLWELWTFPKSLANEFRSVRCSITCTCNSVCVRVAKRQFLGHSYRQVGADSRVRGRVHACTCIHARDGRRAYL